MIPFAVAGVKRVCTNLVKGACRDADMIGGMTNRNLHHKVQSSSVELAIFY